MNTQDILHYFRTWASALVVAMPRSRRLAAKCELEALEKRRLLSAISLSGGTLTITGNSSGENKLAADLTSTGKIYAIANDKFATYSRSSVTAIKIIGGSGKDRLYINNDITTPGDMRGGGGDDYINGGRGNDTVDAGDGNDVIYGRLGNDHISAGAGNDKIYGNEGNDWIDGGDGNDWIEGESGNDTMLGGTGDDVILGASGTDRLEGGDGNDQMKGGLDDDTLLGGAGNDSVAGESGSDYIDGGSGTNSYPGISISDRVPSGSAHATPGADPIPATTVSVGITNNNTVITGAAGDSSTPQPIIQLMGKTGVATHPVHVHALLSKLKIGTPLTARYEWDFGDSGGRFNKLTGWNAAHIYEKSGTYTITLTITNEKGKKGVAADDGQSRRRYPPHHLRGCQQRLRFQLRPVIDISHQDGRQSRVAA